MTRRDYDNASSWRDVNETLQLLVLNLLIKVIKYKYFKLKLQGVKPNIDYIKQEFLKTYNLD